MALGKAHARFTLPLSSLPSVAIETVPMNTDRSRPRGVGGRGVGGCLGGMSAAFFLKSSFLQATSAVMLWPVHGQKDPQASEHLCPAKLQTRSVICCACQSICPFIPTDSGVPRSAVLASLSARSFPLTPACPGQQIYESFCSRRLCMAVCHLGQPIPDSTFCSRFIEFVRMMACVICAPLWQASSHCIARVTASTSMVRMEVVTLWAPLSSCTVLPPCLTVNPQSDGPM